MITFINYNYIVKIHVEYEYFNLNYITYLNTFIIF